ncbi:MAG: pseudaminic acid cytidylyltransferase [Verrucomicrobia bacterium]|nr:pseudaminic acid cytidylyltransferase [Verrucomicrobiota bacterium]
MSILGIIPARGGSKRIPRKNVRFFEGKPILAYSIEAALRTQLFDEVMVSTDDLEIAEVAKSFGASVPFQRSQANSNDCAGTAEVLLEVIGDYERRRQVFEYACCIYPTAPLTTSELLKRGFEVMKRAKYDSVFPILRFSYPIQRALEFKEGRVQMIWPENYAARSQDLPAAYHDAGQFYWFGVEAMKKQKALFMKNSGAIEISPLDAQDIDNVADWNIAELKYRFRSGKDVVKL